MGRLTLGKQGTLTYTSLAQYKVKTRNPYELPTPPEVVHIQFYDIIKVIIQEEDKQYTLELEINSSPITYIRGKKMHISDIQKLYPNVPGVDYPDFVIKQMEGQGYTSAIIFNGISYGFDKTRRFVKDYVRRTENGRKPEGQSTDQHDERKSKTISERGDDTIRETTKSPEGNVRGVSSSKEKRTRRRRKRNRR